MAAKEAADTERDNRRIRGSSAASSTSASRNASFVAKTADDTNGGTNNENTASMDSVGGQSGDEAVTTRCSKVGRDVGNTGKAL